LAADLLVVPKDTIIAAITLQNCQSQTAHSKSESALIPEKQSLAD